jgi:hypothetical protein
MAEMEQLAIAMSRQAIEIDAKVTPEHRALLDSYRMNAHRGERATRDLIISDLRGFLDLGAAGRARDLLIVLWLYLEEATALEARRSAPPRSARRQRESISAQRWREARSRNAYSVGAKRQGVEQLPGDDGARL